MAQPVRFVDAHVHFWDHSVEGLTWRYLDPDFDHPRLRGMHRLDAPAFTVDELMAQAGDRGPQSIVHVQSCEESVPGLESRWIQALADRSGVVGAIVARARVAEPGLAEVLAVNGQNRLFRGVRDMASPQTIGREEFRAGFDLIASAGASLEVLVPYTKFRDVCALADRHPRARIVLGHAGLAERRDTDYFKEWKHHLAMFTTRPNVTVKISALASGADPEWTEASIRPWVLECIEIFGPDRAMFGTNWPIDRLYGTYEQLVDAYRSIVDDHEDTAKASLFGATATRLYDIGSSERE